MINEQIADGTLFFIAVIAAIFGNYPSVFDLPLIAAVSSLITVDYNSWAYWIRIASLAAVAAAHAVLKKSQPLVKFTLTLLYAGAATFIAVYTHSPVDENDAVWWFMFVILIATILVAILNTVVDKVEKK